MLTLSGASPGSSPVSPESPMLISSSARNFALGGTFPRSSWSDRTFWADSARDLAGTFLEGVLGLTALSALLSVIMAVTLLSRLHGRAVLAEFLALLALMRSSDFNDSLDSLFVVPHFSLLGDIKFGEELLHDNPALCWPLDCLLIEEEEEEVEGGTEGVTACFLLGVGWTEVFLL